MYACTLNPLKSLLYHELMMVVKKKTFLLFKQYTGTETFKEKSFLLYKRYSGTQTFLQKFLLVQKVQWYIVILNIKFLLKYENVQWYMDKDDTLCPCTTVRFPDEKNFFAALCTAVPVSNGKTFLVENINLT